MPPQVIHVRDASKVATALANEKCQRILQHLRAHEDATETELANTLKIPLSTIHYNMKILADAKLVHTDTQSYSAKGKTMTHYRAAKEDIIIVQEERMLSSLKAIVPAAILAAGIGIAYMFATRVAPQATEAFGYGASEAPAAKMMLAAPQAADAAVATATNIAAPSTSLIPSEAMPAFFAGVAITAILTICAFLVVRAWEKRARQQ